MEIHRSSERVRDREHKEELRKDENYVAGESKKAREKYSKRDEKRVIEELTREEKHRIATRKLMLSRKVYQVMMMKRSPDFWTNEYSLILDKEFKTDPELAMKLNEEIFWSLCCLTCGKCRRKLKCGKCTEERCSSECLKNIQCKECEATLEHYHGIYQKWLELRLEFAHVIWGGWAMLANCAAYGEKDNLQRMQRMIKDHGSQSFEEFHSTIAANHIAFMRRDEVMGEEFFWSEEYSIYLDSLFQTLPHEERALELDDQRMSGRVCKDCGIPLRETYCGKCVYGNYECGSFLFMKYQTCENLQCKGCKANQDHYQVDYEKWGEKRLRHFNKSWKSWTKDSLTPYVETSSDED